MIDDVYQLALAAVKRHLRQAGSEVREDDGDLIVGGHRLGLSIAFEGFSRQGEQALAPLEVQIHLDGDEGNRFRIGTLGVGATQEEALRAAIDEWYLLSALPVLAALGAEAAAPRRPVAPVIIAGWRLFAGRAGLRGTVPTGLHAGGTFFTTLLMGLREEISRWDEPRDFSLRSILVLCSGEPDKREIQAAVDGFLNQRLTEHLEALPWPPAAEAYFYKQMFVLRHEGST